MSKRKDARWQYAYELAARLGTRYEDYAFEEWQGMLDMAEDFLKEFPENEARLAEKWRDEA